MDLSAPFYQNIQQAYKPLEDLLNGFRTPWNLDFAAKKEPGVDFTEFMTVIKPTNLTQIVTWAGGYASPRVFYPLGNGYGVKLRPNEKIGNTLFTLECKFSGVSGQDVDRQEEHNQEILEEFGFTKEKGFVVQKHKVIGVTLVDRKIVVNPNGTNATLCEDMGEGGYEVTDVAPYHFFTLANKKELFESYQRHLTKLSIMYGHPSLEPSVRRHGTPKDYIDPLTRMMLIRIKENMGELFIGDLNNIFFEKRKPRVPPTLTR